MAEQISSASPPEGWGIIFWGSQEWKEGKTSDPICVWKHICVALYGAYSGTAINSTPNH